MRITLLCACVVALVVGWTGARAEAQGLSTTTEYGISIGPEEIMAGIQETQDFWGPVRNYVAGAEFQVAEAEVRTQAVAFLRSVHDQLHSRLFDGDEATGQDLINFLSWRLRKFEVYRQIRTKLSNDHALAELMVRWEKSHRDINALDAAKRAQRVEELLRHWSAEMKSLDLSAEVIAQAQPLWANLAGCMAQMNATDTGKMMIEYEHKAKQLDRSVAEVVRQVATAADWALITKEGDGSISKASFDVAWKQLADYSTRRLAVTAPGEVK